MLSLRNGIPENTSRRIIMDLNAINTVSNNNYYSNPKSVNSNEKDDTTKKSGFSSEAAVFEKSSDDNVGNVTNKGTDRTALINQLKADQEAMKSQLFEIVRKTISGQGKTIAQADDMWKFLASGDFTVDAETKAKAQEAISEDGYWGVEKTSDRIVDFAIALSGGDTSKAETLLDAFKQGFDEATKAWGKELPEISKKTYEAVEQKFDAWKNGTYGK